MDDSLKDRILEATDIIEVVGERVALKQKGREFVGLCPFHPDHNPSMSVSPTKQIFKCWSCGVGGDVIKFVQLRDQIDFPEALRRLARRAGIEEQQRAVDPRTAALRQRLLAVMRWAKQHFESRLWQSDKQARAALEYASGRRGMSHETIRRFGIGLAPDAWDDLYSAATKAGLEADVLQQCGLIAQNDRGGYYDRFRNRLIFPIHDATGRPIAFGGRTLGDDPAKYLNSPETALFSKSRVLYGLDLARDAASSAREVVVVEGYTDVVLLHQAGVAHAVATLGTSLTDAHVRILRPLVDRAVMCFDSDEAGYRAADRAVEVSLTRGLEVRVALLADGQDPAEFVIGAGLTEFQAKLHSALHALEFKWRVVEKSLSDTTPAARRRAIDQFMTFVAKATGSGGIDPLEQGMLVGRLSDLLKMPVNSIYEMLAKATRPRVGPGKAADPDAESAYDASLRGVPRAVVACVEEILGYVLTDSAHYEWAENSLMTCAGYCPAWAELDSALRARFEENGAFDRAEIMAACDDPATLELIERATRRVAGAALSADAGRRLCERLGAEADLEEMGRLRQSLGVSSGADDARRENFKTLLNTARRRQDVLSADKRWNMT